MKNIKTKLYLMHSFLMEKGFPYHSVSVIHRHQDLGLHVIFLKNVKDKVTEEIKKDIESEGFSIFYVA